jgi:hypothetical protein
MRHVIVLLAFVTAVLTLSCDEVVETSNPSPPNDWTNQQARQKYREVADGVCAAFVPEYFGLAIEVNTYYQYHPEDFERFVDEYKNIYDMLKSTSGCTNTKIFVTFQLEQMKGLGRSVGLSGLPQWEILDKFEDKLDLLVFTTYPEMEYSAPSEMPDDYYTSIMQHIPTALSGRKLAFSEMGWNSENLISVTGENNTYITQAKFVERFATLTSEMKNAGRIEFAAWAWMHDFRDTGAYHPFRTVGLHNSDGGAKDVNDTAWNTWIAFKDFVGSAYRLGVGPIPRHFPGSTSEDWLDMYRKVPQLGALILAQTDWFDQPESAGQIPQGLRDLEFAKVYHHAVLIYAINFFAHDNGEPKLAL